MQLDPYLHFNGNCEEAFKVYEKALGGKITFKATYGEASPAAQSTPDFANKIMHMRLDVNGRVLMGSDVPGDRYQAPQGFSMSLSAKDAAEADRLFNEMSKNGKIIMPIQQTFWSPRFGMFTDQFGIPWMVNTEQPASTRTAHGS
jgi:PhnB protein